MGNFFSEWKTGSSVVLWSSVLNLAPRARRWWHGGAFGASAPHSEVQVPLGWKPAACSPEQVGTSCRWTWASLVPEQAPLTLGLALPSRRTVEYTDPTAKAQGLLLLNGHHERACPRQRGREPVPAGNMRLRLLGRAHWRAPERRKGSLGLWGHPDSWGACA